MNKFDEIKHALTNQQVAEHYLGKPDKYKSTGLWYKSPFRAERTASFCVSDRGIHDFGDSSHYDMFSFVAKLYKINDYEALEVIAHDFNLSLENEYENSEILKIIKRKKAEEQYIKQRIAKWFVKEFNQLCDEYQTNKKIIRMFDNNETLLKVLYDEDMKLELQLEEFLEADEQKKEQMFLERL